VALHPDRARLVRVAAAVAARDEGRLDDALREAVACPGEAVDEVLLQSHLFVGFPIALEGLVRWREVCGQPPGDALDEPPELWRRRGEEVCERVYGASYPRLRANVRSIHPDLDRWMVENGYGRVIGRPGLDLATRELCIAALLVAWDAPRQLHSHLRGALNAGASPGELAGAVEIAADYASPAAAARARDLLHRVLNR
jgi:4-carboxymuconolactone decarboxylase